MSGSLGKTPLYSPQKMRVKKAALILVLFKKHFDPAEPLKGSQGPSGLFKQNYTLGTTPVVYCHCHYDY